jgi:ATP-binding cassette subfamily B protein
MKATNFPAVTAISDVSWYAHRPVAFTLRFVCQRWVAHAAILLAVLGAVACSVGTQYGIKLLVDTLTHSADGVSGVWPAFGLLIALIAADSGLWRLADFVAHSAFVGITGDLRRDLFCHMTGHAPGYFAERMPGKLASRITATSNAVFTVENLLGTSCRPVRQPLSRFLWSAPSAWPWRLFS